MLEVIEKYCEDNYARKSDVEKEFGSYVFHSVWKEIDAYRKQHAYTFDFMDEKYEMVWHRKTTFLCLQIERSLYRYAKQHTFSIQDIIGFDEATTHSIHAMIHQFQTSYIEDKVQWFQNALATLHMQSKDYYNLLFDMQQPIIFRFYLSTFHPIETERKILHIMILLMEDLLELHPFFLKTQVTYTLEEDVTYEFLTFLSNIRLQIFHDMVSLPKNEETHKHKTLQELLESFPQLSKQQISFFIDHREIKHYYTIAQYMDYHHVCYETARYSLEKMVELHWYQKKKTGKKYVYYVM